MWKNASLIYYPVSNVMRFTWCLQCRTKFFCVCVCLSELFWTLVLLLFDDCTKIRTPKMVISTVVCILFGCNSTLCTLLATFCLSNRPETEKKKHQQTNKPNQWHLNRSQNDKKWAKEIGAKPLKDRNRKWPSCTYVSTTLWLVSSFMWCIVCWSFFFFYCCPVGVIFSAKNFRMKNVAHY